MEKSIEYYMNLPYALRILPDMEEGGYAAEYSELPGCITCGDSIEEVIRLAEDAKRCWLLTAILNNDNIPLPTCISLT